MFALADRCGGCALDTGEEHDSALTMDIVSVPPNRGKLLR